MVDGLSIRPRGGITRESGQMKDKNQKRKMTEQELEALMRSPAKYQEEAKAPPVDRDLLFRLVRNELPREEVRRVYEIVDSFKSWTLAHDEIVAEQYERTRAQPQRTASRRDR